jgi:tocopherol O-methyltransferase
MSAEPAKVATWYDRKTAAILKKYGPGPRVHFHLGLDLASAPPLPGGDWCASIGSGPESGPAGDVARQALVAGQEALLTYAASAWDAPRCLSGEVLDVGCGLGGGALFWAELYGASVTAITVAPHHVPIVTRFAQQAGLSSRVRAQVADACSYERRAPFDAAVALEAACYWSRADWFQRLQGLIRPGGYVFVEDTFLADPRVAAEFDDYWQTRIGTVEEYVHAASRAGFRLESQVDLTAATVGFWSTSRAWSLIELRTQTDPEERARLQRSIERHLEFQKMWENRRILCQLLCFRRSAPLRLAHPAT